MTKNPFENGCAWIDGDYVPMAEARISILDTGFTRSDLTHDVVSVWNGRFFRLEAHLNRFENNFNRLRMTRCLSKQERREILFECVRRSGIKTAYVQMIMTRGVPPQGVRDPRQFENRFYAFAIPYVWILKMEDQEIGTHIVICRDTVRIPPQSIDPTVKNFHWGDLVQGMFETYDRGGVLAVLADAEGHITEGPGFNLFAYHKGVLRTPARGVLEGITRMTVLELAEALEIPTSREMFGMDVLKKADEIFLSSTAGGVLPVTTMDGSPIKDGKPGKITMQLRKRYWEAHDEDRWSTPVDYSGREQGA